jgi:hypothetical protein
VTRFGVCFLMVFGQLAFGGTLALAIPPFFKIERGFYRSSAAVYLSAGLLAAIGLGLLAARGYQPGSPPPGLLWTVGAIWIAFCASLALYMSTLWTENGALRARAYSSALAIGLVAVLTNALVLKPAAFGALAMVLYGATAVLSSMILGLSSGAMLFGHWYLIDPNLPVDYLRSFVRLLGFTLLADLALLIVVPGLLAIAGGTAAASAARGLAGSELPMLATRLVLGPLASLALTWMCWQTLKIPQTMAATGLLYITVMSVLVGELIGRFILFRTAIPL